MKFTEKNLEIIIFRTLLLIASEANKSFFSTFDSGTFSCHYDNEAPLWFLIIFIFSCTTTSFRIHSTSLPRTSVYFFVCFSSELDASKRFEQNLVASRIVAVSINETHLSKNLLLLLASHAPFLALPCSSKMLIRHE